MECQAASLCQWLWSHCVTLSVVCLWAPVVAITSACWEKGSHFSLRAGLSIQSSTSFPGRWPCVLGASDGAVMWVPKERRTTDSAFCVLSKCFNSVVSSCDF